MGASLRAKSHWSQGQRAARGAGSPCNSARQGRLSTSPDGPRARGASEMNRPETIEETAALVDTAGGRGIAVEVDHLVPEQVRALVERIASEQGALHVLVNDIWGATVMEWNKTVWESSLENRTAQPAPRRRYARDHESLRDSASSQDTGWPGRRGDRWHGRVQRDPLPRLLLLRPGEGGGQSHGVCARPRAGTAKARPRSP